MVNILLYPQEVKERCNKFNIEYYKSIGLNSIQINDRFTLQASQLYERSSVKVEILCDYCLENGLKTTIIRQYNIYINSRKIIPKDACAKCGRTKKLVESNMKVYGVASTRQLKEIADAVNSKLRTDIEEINKILDDKNFILVEGEIFTNKSKQIKVICKKHPELIQTTNINSIEKSKGCKHCAYNRKKYKLSQIEILFSDKGYKLLSDEYKGNSVPLDYICLRHPQTTRKLSLSALLSGQRCKSCAGEDLSRKRRKDFNDVVNLFNQKGLELLSTEKDYVNSLSKLKYRCPIHKDIIQEKTYNSLSQGGGCYLCGIKTISDKIKGTNHYLWNGGYGSVSHYLRNTSGYVHWRNCSLEKHKYTCPVSNFRGSLVVHHTYSFHKIVKEACNKLHLPVQNVSEYSEVELNNLESYFNEIHMQHLGVPLRRDVHKLYHSIYGYENTEEQFECFLLEYGDFFK